MATYEIPAPEIGAGVSRLVVELDGHRLTDAEADVETNYGVDDDGQLSLKIVLRRLKKESR